MRLTEAANELSRQAFEFFYWFSRFEFALKENSYLKGKADGRRAEPDWNGFIQDWQESYVITPEAESLLASPPEIQIVTREGLAWKPVSLEGCHSDLDKVVRLIKTVRNNLFHGGKHGNSGWDDPDRTAKLLSASKAVLDTLARMAEMEADYTQFY